MSQEICSDDAARDCCGRLETHLWSLKTEAHCSPASPVEDKLRVEVADNTCRHWWLEVVGRPVRDRNRKTLCLAMWHKENLCTATE